MIYVPVIVNLLLIVTTHFTHFIIFIDENGQYNRGVLQPFTYIVCAYHLSFAAVYALRHRKKLSRQVVVSIVAFICLTLSAVIIQIINPHILIECFASSVCILIIMFTLQNQDDMIDLKTKMLNSSSFFKDCRINYSSNQRFSVLLIRIPDFTLFIKTFGGRFSEKLLCSFSEYLYSFVNLGEAYYLEDECFALTFTKDFDCVGKTYREILTKLSSNWKFESVNTYISASFLRIDCPSDTKDVEVFIDYVDRFRQMPFRADKLLMTSDIDLGDKNRRSDVEKAVIKAVENRNFEVYYQPIYNVENGEIVSCEALLRLFDEKLGEISPVEMIPIAEQNGQIIKIGRYVFEEACRFIKKGSAAAMGIDCVQVNLSSVQCMQSDLVEHFVNIVDKYKVETSKICLQISEISASYTPYVMEQNILMLAENGFKLALDDYGKGYSNVNYLLKFPFRTVKIDKELVWSAFENHKNAFALAGVFAMLRNLDLDITAEGVENVHQFENLSNMGCDYMQGDFFSKAVNEKDFIKLLEDTNTRYLPRENAEIASEEIKTATLV